jgi:hypothetical protein
MREHAASTTNSSTTKPSGTTSSSSSIDEATGEEYAVWCPALQLSPAPEAALKALMDGSSASSSNTNNSSSSSSSVAVLPASLALDPNAYADPESLALGVLPAKGCMVHVTQVRCLRQLMKQIAFNSCVPAPLSLGVVNAATHIFYTR